MPHQKVSDFRPRCAFHCEEGFVLQIDPVDRMQTRSRLYELLQYERYSAFDSDIFSFTLNLDTPIRMSA